ncbi:MAG: methyltransferase [Nitrospirae bacterium]|nr:methyltransferase [Nitrospirota bacterium]
MTISKHSAPFSSFKDPADFQRLRGVFEAAGYCNTNVLEKLGVRDFPSIRGSDVSLLLSKTGGGTALDTIIRLFLIEVPCDIENMKLAFQPLKLEALAETGLIRITGTSAEAAIKLLPHNDLFITFDQTRMLQTGHRQNYVMGIGSSTLTLSNLTIRKRSRQTLDLGAGCGIHAFMAAKHSERVIAVDLNPRAVQIASFNARLNGLSNVECLEGDLFAPVKGQKFDLVITNPPFVISPETRYIYRDGGLEADQLCRKIVREVPQYLNEGGYCQILCNWIEPHGQE